MCHGTPGTPRDDGPAFVVQFQAVQNKKLLSPQEVEKKFNCFFGKFEDNTGLSSLGVPGVPWHTQILADQLTLFQPRGTDYANLITTGTLGFSDLPTNLQS